MAAMIGQIIKNIASCFIMFPSDATPGGLALLTYNPEVPVSNNSRVYFHYVGLPISTQLRSLSQQAYEEY
jgi:hypothetical protein